MARLADDAGRDVARVVESHEVGEAVDLDPLDGLAALDGSGDLLDLRRIREHLTVAVHADAGGRDAGVAALLGPKVAILAVDLLVPGVESVGIGDRLNGLVALACPLRLAGSGQQRGGREEQAGGEEASISGQHGTSAPLRP